VLNELELKSIETKNQENPDVRRLLNHIEALTAQNSNYLNMLHIISEENKHD
jgi:hypothetical protein